MRAKHKKRLAIVLTAVIALSAATLLLLNALKSNIVFFHPPTDIHAGKAPKNKTIRIGGMVKKGSVVRGRDNLIVSFIVTDFNKEINVSYKGILPDLFREDQGVIVEGKLQPDMQFVASRVLAKHDENYMPPEAAEAIKKGKAMSAPRSTRSLIEN